MKSENVEYKEGSTVCEGFAAYDERAKKPGVLIVPEWNGMPSVSLLSSLRLDSASHQTSRCRLEGTASTTRRSAPGMFTSHGEHEPAYVTCKARSKYRI